MAFALRRHWTFGSASFGRSTGFLGQRHYCNNTQSSITNFAERIVAGDRVSLAKAITLVESTLVSHRRQAEQLISILLEQRKNARKDTFRIGISGPPGVGKSTLIEQFGMYLVEKQKQRVAVLAVDPSSVRSGGSILGDKTRMPDLSRHPNAYVRPSPTRGTLGGVTRSTSEAILICEAGGYEAVLVETVGVGQSETAVEDMVDAFVLLVPPAGGDELQGIKKGIVELADLVVVTKADGDLVAEARRANTEYSSALRLLRYKHNAWRPRVLTYSSITGVGADQLWDALSLFRKTMQDIGEWEDKRGRQQSNWMWKLLHEELFMQFETHPRVKKLLPLMESQVRAGTITASAAAGKLLNEFLQKPE